MGEKKLQFDDLDMQFFSLTQVAKMSGLSHKTITRDKDSGLLKVNRRTTEKGVRYQVSKRNYLIYMGYEIADEQKNVQKKHNRKR